MRLPNIVVDALYDPLQPLPPDRDPNAPLSAEEVEVLDRLVRKISSTEAAVTVPTPGPTKK